MDYAEMRKIVVRMQSDRKLDHQHRRRMDEILRYIDQREAYVEELEGAVQQHYARVLELEKGSG